MNRYQRRLRQKQIRKNGSYRGLAALLAAVNKSADKDSIKDGDRVMLNTKRIMGRKEFATMNPAYQEFVKKNSLTVFTAKVRRRYASGAPILIDLAEDDTWSFWEGDLIRKGSSPKKTEG